MCDPTTYSSSWKVKSFDRTKGTGVLERPGNEDVVFDFEAWSVDPAQLRGSDELLPCPKQSVLVSWKKSFRGKIVPTQIKPLGHDEPAAQAPQPIPADLPSSLDKLWRLALRLGGPDGREDIGAVFGEVGLFLSPLVQSAYECTPKDAMAFGWTGGDGVHFSLLQVGESLENAPVVMTVPMNFGAENLILGANLDDLLALGCMAGFDGLEQLVYERAHAIEVIADAQEIHATRKPHDSQLLSALIDEFNLKPWVDIATKLARLQVDFGPPREWQRPG
jgi:hypothetical protein